MRSSNLLDRMAPGAFVEQTGVRFEFSRIQLQPMGGEPCVPHPQIVIMEVYKSLGSAANE